MSKAFKPKPVRNLLGREVVLQLRNFRPRVVQGSHLVHFSTLPHKGGTKRALAVYQQASV